MFWFESIIGMTDGDLPEFRTHSPSLSHKNFCRTGCFRVRAGVVVGSLTLSESILIGRGAGRGRGLGVASLSDWSRGVPWAWPRL